MKWIVGLGNPGDRYRDTRHNIGFLAVDRAAERWGIRVSQHKMKAIIGEGNVKGQKVYLIKPQTYMNLSGEAVRAFMDYYKADLQDLIVLYDDFDTDFGKIRLRYQGSAGGHNGVRSIIQHIGTQSFQRIRLGISRPPAGYDIADYVLSSFSKEERQKLPEVLDLTADALDFALDSSFEKTMARFNG